MTSNPIDGLNAALDGRYRIEKEIGRGGMASVYLAHDLRHDRRVAFKVLRSDMAAAIGAERFLSEIRTTASLQHPHILPLFDSGEVEGLLFFVMPFVEGETLRDRLDRERQLPVDEAIRIAAEVGEALDYAHRQGVVHRDVKPANVLLHDGRALVADFGIALAVRQAGGDRLTETGLSLGTPHYMSPEQAAGDRPVDARSDVFALGAVLYEMLTGDPPFAASGTQAVLAKILTAEPAPVRELRRSVPLHVEATVMTTLEKLPADRLPSAGDVVRALRDPTQAPPWPSEDSPPSAGRAGAPAGPRLSRRVLLAMNASLLAAVAALAGWVWTRGDAATDGPMPSPWVTRIALDVDPVRFTGAPALSADGRVVAWSTAEGVRVRSLDRLDARLLPGTAGGSGVHVAPDASAIAYLRAGDLNVVPLEGGEPRSVVQSLEALMHWAEDGSIYGLGSRAAGPPATLRIRLRSAAVDTVWQDSTRMVHVTDVLPDGEHALVNVISWMAGPSEIQPAVLDLASGTLRMILPEVETLGSPTYEPRTGLLLFTGGDPPRIMAVPFDAERLEVEGSPFVALDNGFGWVARDGTLLAVESRDFTRTTPVLLDRQGRPLSAAFEVPDGYEFKDAYFSPDGGRLVAEMRAPGEDADNLWVYALPDGPLTRLTWDGGEFPAWTRDGEAILFARDDGIHRVPADGTAPPELRVPGSGIWWLRPTAGGDVVFEQRNDSSFDVGRASLTGDSTIELLVSGPANEEDPDVSPDGRWLAYESDESGRRQVYVMPYGRPGRGRQVSIAGGNNPLWSRTGEALHFVNEQGTLERLRVRTDPTFQVVSRDTLFTRGGNFAGRMDAAPGDSVFLALREVGPGFDTRLVLVRNWIRELEARAREARENAGG